MDRIVLHLIISFSSQIGQSKFSRHLQPESGKKQIRAHQGKPFYSSFYTNAWARRFYPTKFTDKLKTKERQLILWNAFNGNKFIIPHLKASYIFTIQIFYKGSAGMIKQNNDAFIYLEEGIPRLRRKPCCKWIFIIFFVSKTCDSWQWSCNRHLSE